jgi:hypothetical protein
MFRMPTLLQFSDVNPFDAESSLRSHHMLQWSKHSLPFMEPRHKLLGSQGPNQL